MAENDEPTGVHTRTAPSREDQRITASPSTGGSPHSLPFPQGARTAESAALPTAHPNQFMPALLNRNKFIVRVCKRLSRRLRPPGRRASAEAGAVRTRHDSGTGRKAKEEL